MNIEQLEYVVEIAKTGSISDSSNNLHVSSAAISKAISNLEKELGVILFKRSRTGTLPTEESKQLIKKAHEIINKIQEFKEEAQIQTALINGDLKLSAIPSFFMTILPKTLLTFYKDHPDVNIFITEKGSQPIINEIKENKIDLGLIATFDNVWEENEELAFEVLLEGKVQVFVSKHSHLAYCDTVTPKDLLGETIVTYNGDVLNFFINDFFNKYGALKILFTSTNTEVIKKTVAEGLAIYFSFDLGQQNDHRIDRGDIIPIPLVNHTPVNIYFGAVRSKKKHFSASTKMFLKYLKNQIVKENY